MVLRTRGLQLEALKIIHKLVPEVTEESAAQGLIRWRAFPARME